MCVYKECILNWILQWAAFKTGHQISLMLVTSGRPKALQLTIWSPIPGLDRLDIGRKKRATGRSYRPDPPQIWLSSVGILSSQVHMKPPVRMDTDSEKVSFTIFSTFFLFLVNTKIMQPHFEIVWLGCFNTFQHFMFILKKLKGTLGSFWLKAFFLFFLNVRLNAYCQILISRDLLSPPAHGVSIWHKPSNRGGIHLPCKDVI